MKSHQAIIAGVGDEALVSRLGVKPHQVRDWRLRDSIPPEWWPALERQGVATVAELAGYIESKRLGRPSQPEQSARPAA